VEVVLCPDNLTDIDKLYCWDDSSRPHTRCAANGTAGCSYQYSLAATPTVYSSDPLLGAAGTSISMTGLNLGSIATVAMLTGVSSTMAGTCAINAKSSSSLDCTVPSLPAGAYTLQLRTATGELSIDPNNEGRFLLLPTITSATTTAANGTALPLAAGSLAGGSMLTLTSSADSAGFNGTNATSNVVTVAGQPCPVVSVNSSHLSCQVPRAASSVLAEYWAMPRGGLAMPDLTTYNNPGALKLPSSHATHALLCIQTNFRSCL
jgi:hypothetical protein